MQENPATFYILKISLNEKEAGHRAANEKQYDWQSPRSQGKLNSRAFPEFEPHFSGVILTKRSVQSDFLNDSGAIGGRGFIVSCKVRDLFEHFKLPPHRYYPLRILANPSEEIINTDNYFWMQIILEDFAEWINLKQSKLILINEETDEEQLLQLDSSASFRKLLKEYNTDVDETMEFDHIQLNTNYSKKGYDLFILEDLLFAAIISERLKLELEKLGITGCMPFKQLNIGVDG